MREQADAARTSARASALPSFLQSLPDFLALPAQFAQGPHESVLFKASPSPRVEVLVGLGPGGTSLQTRQPRNRGDQKGRSRFGIEDGGERCPGIGLGKASRPERNEEAFRAFGPGRTRRSR